MGLACIFPRNMIQFYAYCHVLFWSLTITEVLPFFIFRPQDSNSRFGERQVEQLLDDRPELASILDENQVLRNWIRDRFSAGTLKQRVFWDASEPVSGMDSECVMPTEFHRAHIRVTSRTNVAADDKCVYLMFEFMNLDNEDSFNRLYRLVYERQVDREQFVNRAIRLEMEAAVRLAVELQKDSYSKIFSKSKLYQAYISLPKQISSSDIKKWEKNEGVKRSLDYWRSTFDRLTGR